MVKPFCFLTFPLPPMLHDLPAPSSTSWRPRCTNGSCGRGLSSERRLDSQSQRWPVTPLSQHSAVFTSTHTHTHKSLACQHTYFHIYRPTWAAETQLPPPPLPLRSCQASKNIMKYSASLSEVPHFYLSQLFHRALCVAAGTKGGDGACAHCWHPFRSPSFPANKSVCFVYVFGHVSPAVSILAVMVVCNWVRAKQGFCLRVALRLHQPCCSLNNIRQWTNSQDILSAYFYPTTVYLSGVFFWCFLQTPVLLVWANTWFTRFVLSGILMPLSY